MDALDFNLIVLPLGILVFALVAGVILIVEREEIAKKRKTRRLDRYLKEKAKQRELMENQIVELDKLFVNKSIDEDTCKRLKTLIRMNEEKSDETIEVLSTIAGKE